MMLLSLERVACTEKRVYARHECFCWSQMSFATLIILSEQRTYLGNTNGRLCPIPPLLCNGEWNVGTEGPDEIL